jgi:hypothetical protein
VSEHLPKAARYRRIGLPGDRSGRAFFLLYPFHNLNPAFEIPVGARRSAC